MIARVVQYGEAKKEKSPNRKGIKKREGSTVLRGFSRYFKIFFNILLVFVT
jgi:hypothetical protein